MDEKDTFPVVGKEFDSYEQFLQMFHAFCTTNYEPLTINTNNQRQVTILCRYGVNRPSQSTGKRTKLRYNYLGCQAKITCYKPSNSTIVRVTSVNLQHNHELSKTAFRTEELSDKEKEVVSDLYEANYKVSQICRVLKSKFDKNLSTQKLRNVIRKLIPNNDDYATNQRYHRSNLNDSIINSESGDNHAIIDEDYPEEQCDTEEKVKAMSFLDKYNAILPVMLNIANTAASYDTAQFTHYFEVLSQVEKFVRDGCELKIGAPDKQSNEKDQETNIIVKEEPHTFASIPSKNMEEFEDLRFRPRSRPKLKARRRLKRPEQRFHSFKKSTVGNEGVEQNVSIERENDEPLSTQ